MNHRLRDDTTLREFRPDLLRGAGSAEEEEANDLEQGVLNRLAIEEALAQLDPTDAILIKLLYAYECPSDYDGQWPPTTEDIGIYLARREADSNATVITIPVRTIWHWHAQILERWRAARATPSLKAAA